MPSLSGEASEAGSSSHSPFFDRLFAADTDPTDSEFAEHTVGIGLGFFPAAAPFGLVADLGAPLQPSLGLEGAMRGFSSRRLRSWR